MSIELSTDQILSKVVIVANNHVRNGAKVLDIGSGTGALISLLKQTRPGIETYACDYTETLMQVFDQNVDIANLNEDSLPYSDEAFDLATCTEVIEHLENYHRIVREVARVMKPGGIAVFSTPNILNLQSRLRFLFFGFWNLFGPLPIGRGETFSTAGHITPVSFFYLAHAISEAGLELLALEIDKIQKSALPKLLLLWPFIKLFGHLAKRREVRKYRTIRSDNIHLIGSMNSIKMLLGRTIIVAVSKPG